MPVALRLVLIVLAALIASHLVAAIVLFQPFLLFISVVSYPVTVAASTVSPTQFTGLSRPIACLHGGSVLPSFHSA